MLMVPREKPVMGNLNSYYLDIKKLFEHFQGEIGSGCIHFKSATAEGEVFFDKDELLSGVFRDREGESNGQDTLDRLIGASHDHNFNIDIYGIHPSKIYFWSNVPSAKEVYKDLSTEFTDLDGLIRNMRTVKFTGYIDVSMNKEQESGLIFFNHGEIIGGSYSWLTADEEDFAGKNDLLVKKTLASGGTFNVCRISLKNVEGQSRTEQQGGENSSATLSMLEEALVTFEKMVAGNKKLKEGFDTLLKKKFVEKADDYAFLDPFVGEFEYLDEKIEFTGNASDEELADGVFTCIRELAAEVAMLPQLLKVLSSWSRNHAKELDRLGLRF